MLASRDDESNPGESHVYRGYLVDLLDALAKHASFTYSLRAVPDHQHGSRRQDGTWSGLVGEIIAGVRILPVCTGEVHSNANKAFLERFSASLTIHRA